MIYNTVTFQNILYNITLTSITIMLSIYVLLRFAPPIVFKTREHFLDNNKDQNSQLKGTCAHGKS